MRADLETLVDVLAGRGAVVLSGAGLSTESGIPDYRGPSGQARRAQPMTYQAFTGSQAARQRYWARSHLGWRHIAGAAPNAGHQAVAELERLGLIRGIITQNVDGLHQAAGATLVTELHGSLHRVVCLGCWRRTSRAELDERLRTANPDWAPRVSPHPGLHVSCLEWFREKDIAAIAWDMMDERPSGYPGFGMSTHLAIPFLGLALVDNTDPERLARACAEEGRAEFLFTATPLRLVGATGAPEHPIAIF